MLLYCCCRVDDCAIHVEEKTLEGDILRRCRERHVIRGPVCVALKRAVEAVVRYGI